MNAPTRYEMDAYGGLAGSGAAVRGPVRRRSLRLPGAARVLRFHRGVPDLHRQHRRRPRHGRRAAGHPDHCGTVPAGVAADVHGEDQRPIGGLRRPAAARAVVGQDRCCCCPCSIGVCPGPLLDVIEPAAAALVGSGREVAEVMQPLLLLPEILLFAGGLVVLVGGVLPAPPASMGDAHHRRCGPRGRSRRRRNRSDRPRCSAPMQGTFTVDTATGVVRIVAVPRYPRGSRACHRRDRRLAARERDLRPAAVLHHRHPRPGRCARPARGGGGVPVGQHPVLRAHRHRSHTAWGRGDHEDLPLGGAVRDRSAGWHRRALRGHGDDGLRGTSPTRLAGAPTGAVAAGVVAILVGLLFKAGGVPGHFWVPDAAQGAGGAVAAFVTTVPKIGAISPSTGLPYCCPTPWPGHCSSRCWPRPA